MSLAQNYCKPILNVYETLLQLQKKTENLPSYERERDRVCE